MTNDDYRDAVREALRSLAKGQQIPDTNEILYLDSVNSRLVAEGRPDNPTERGRVVVQMFKDAIEALSLRKDTGRPSDKPRSNLLRLMVDTIYQDPNPASFTRRTYERLHPAMVCYFANWLREQVPRDGIVARWWLSAKARLADAEAQEISRWIHSHPSASAVVPCHRLVRFATVIKDEEYHAAAQPYLELAVDRLQQWPYSTFALQTLAEAARRLGHGEMVQGVFSEAVVHLQMQAELGHDLDDAFHEIDGQHMLGVAYATSRDYHQAWDQLMLALDKANVAQHHLPDYEDRRAWIERDMISVAANTGRFIEAGTLAKESLSIRERLHDTQGLPTTWQAWAHALVKEARRTGSQAKLEEAKAKQQEADTTIGLVSSQLKHVVHLITWAELYYAFGDYPAGWAFAKEARDLAFARGQWDQVDRVDRLLALHGMAPRTGAALSDNATQSGLQA